MHQPHTQHQTPDQRVTSCLIPPCALTRSEYQAGRCMQNIQVFVIDQHTISRQGLRAMLSDLPGIALAGEARTLAEAAPMLTSARPDVVLLNLLLPTPAGASAITRLK